MTGRDCSLRRSGLDRVPGRATCETIRIEMPQYAIASRGAGTRSCSMHAHLMRKAASPWLKFPAASGGTFSKRPQENPADGCEGDGGDEATATVASRRWFDARQGEKPRTYKSRDTMRGTMRDEFSNANIINDANLEDVKQRRPTFALRWSRARLRVGPTSSLHMFKYCPDTFCKVLIARKHRSRSRP